MAATKRSAAILLYKITSRNELRVLLVHPGGPFWAKKDLGAWSLPKGEYEEDEDPISAAAREFAEETGTEIDTARLVDLGSVKQKNGKLVTAWALEGDFDVARLRSNPFTIEWPRGSGSTKQFPEIDRAEWFSPRVAREKVLAGQDQLIDRLVAKLGEQGVKIQEFEEESETLF